MTDPARLYNHFAGSALGTMIGDALGMPVEGWPAELIRRKHGRLDDLVDGRFPAGSYTDDTEMTIGLLEALVEAPDTDPALIAARFLANFHPERGYGGRIYGLMGRLAAGESWDRVGTDSFGNGAAMRAAPAGFFHYDRMDRVVDTAVQQARITHRHPEAVAGAVMQAVAVALAVQHGLERRPIDPDAWIDRLAGLGSEHDPESGRRLAAFRGRVRPGHPPAHQAIAAAYNLDVKAVEAVGPAILAFLFTHTFPDAVVLAVNLGGDTDTIGAMAGAVAGAHHGLDRIPQHWIQRLENGPLGRDHFLNLCRRAARQRVDLE